MLALALDTSTPAVSVAVSGGAGAAASRTAVASNRHGELLAPLVHQVLADLGVAPADLAALGVGVGPGPFTGLRVGIVTAAAMGDVLGIPVYAACSLDLIAASGTNAGAGRVAVLSDARRKQVYWAVYADGRRVTEPALDRPEDVAAQLYALDVRTACGAGAVLYRDRLGEVSIDEESAYPSAAALAELALARVRSGSPADVLTPMYLRRPDAVPPGPPKRVTPA